MNNDINQEFQTIEAQPLKPLPGLAPPKWLALVMTGFCVGVLMSFLAVEFITKPQILNYLKDHEKQICQP